MSADVRSFSESYALKCSTRRTERKSRDSIVLYSEAVSTAQRRNADKG